MPPANELLDGAFARALRFARRSLAGGNFPVGAVVLARDGQVIGGGGNRAYEAGLATEHAEMLAIRRGRRHIAAASPGDLTLVTTGEPCLMCLGAIFQIPAIGTVAWAIGPVSVAGSAWEALRAAGYARPRFDGLRVLAEPSARVRSASAALLHTWCAERDDPRAAWFGDPAAAPRGSATRPPRRRRTTASAGPPRHELFCRDTNGRRVTA